MKLTAGDYMAIAESSLELASRNVRCCGQSSDTIYHIKRALEAVQAAAELRGDEEDVPF